MTLNYGFYVKDFGATFEITKSSMWIKQEVLAINEESLLVRTTVKLWGIVGRPTTTSLQ